MCRLGGEPWLAFLISSVSVFPWELLVHSRLQINLVQLAVLEINKLQAAIIIFFCVLSVRCYCVMLIINYTICVCVTRKVTYFRVSGSQDKLGFATSVTIYMSVWHPSMSWGWGWVGGVQGTACTGHQSITGKERSISIFTEKDSDIWPIYSVQLTLHAPFWYVGGSHLEKTHSGTERTCKLHTDLN